MRARWPARLVDVVHQEHAALEARQRGVELLAVEPRRHAFEPVEHARLVAFGLQLAEEPRAGVRQPFVVEVHRVLRGQYDPHSKRARLFEQRQQRRLRGRVGHGRQIAEHLVHVEHRA